MIFLVSIIKYLLQTGTVQHAKGQYLAFVNNDTVLESDCLVVLNSQFSFLYLNI